MMRSPTVCVSRCVPGTSWYNPGTAQHQPPSCTWLMGQYQHHCPQQKRPSSQPIGRVFICGHCLLNTTGCDGCTLALSVTPGKLMWLDHSDTLTAEGEEIGGVWRSYQDGPVICPVEHKRPWTHHISPGCNHASTVPSSHHIYDI